MNKFIGIGRITKDIELAYTQDGKAVAKYTLAINGYNDTTDFLNCVTWNKQAENLKKYCGKGSQIAVEGRVSVRNYENKEGKKVYVTEIVTNNIMFLDSKKDGQAPREDTYNDLHTTTSSDDSAFADFGNQIELSEEDIDFDVAF
jgi:single-strand DNA-binding protein